MHTVVVMGVAGCGKSSLGASVSRATGLPLVEGVDHQGPAGSVMTCSALKASYRARLRAAAPGLRFVFLEIQKADALQRVAARGAAHFLSTTLVDNQFATLEDPTAEHGVLPVDAMAPLPLLTSQVSQWLNHHKEAV